MAAIITDDFRKNNIDRFFNDVFTAQGSGGKNYYVGIGKTDPYEADTEGDLESVTAFDPPVPTGSVIEKDDVKKNLMTLIKVGTTDVKRLVPQIKFQIGRKFKVYNPSDPTCFDAANDGDFLPCYALYTGTDNVQRVYVCLGNNNGGVTSEVIPPMIAGTLFPYTAVQNSTDNYIWAYAFTFNRVDANKFSDSRTFIDLPRNEDVDTILSGITNGRSRSAQGTAGLLYGFHIHPTRNGKSYPGVHPTTLNATIVGKHIDGDTISANNTCTVTTGTNGEIARVNWTLTQAQALGYGRTNTTNSAGSAVSGLTETGSGGIKEASLVITDSSLTVGGIATGQGDFDAAGFEKAEIDCLIAPQNGFGHSPQLDMPSYYAGISADFKGGVGNEATGDNAGENEYVEEALVDVQIREVSLLVDTNNTMATKYSSGDHAEDDSPWSETDYTAEQALNCLQYFQCLNDSTAQANAAAANAIPGAYVEQDIGSGVKARAWLDQVSRLETSDPADADPNDAGNQQGGFRIYFHQNSARQINQFPFSSSGSLTFRNPNGTQIGSSALAYTVIKGGEYVQGEGDVLFVDTRKPITRNTQQTEEVRLILQF